MSDRGSYRKYAEHRKALGLSGGSHVAVKKAVDSGRIAAAMGTDGKIDFARADALWASNTDAIQGARNPGGRKKEAAAAPTPTLDQPRAPAPQGPAPQVHAPDPSPADSRGVSLVQAQTMKAIYAAQREKLAFEEESKKKIDADGVRVRAFNRARSARNSLMAAASRIAPLLVGLDIHTLTITLEDELRKVCEEISRDATTPI